VKKHVGAINTIPGITLSTFLRSDAIIGAKMFEKIVSCYDVISFVSIYLFFDRN
jgi:hypothetical protein